MKRSEMEIGFRNAMLHLGKRPISTSHGGFVVHFFRDLAGERTAMAVVCGDIRTTSPLLARVHSSCLTSECLMGRDCDCAAQLDGALRTMAFAGAGVLFYLMQEGRGAGLSAKARDRMMVQASRNRMTTFEAYAEMGLPPDLRRYEAVAAMSSLLGIRAPLRLLTNNPDKAFAVAKVLAEVSIEVDRTEPIQGPTSGFNSDYLSSKHDAGHALDRPELFRAVLPPARVEVVPPIVLPGQPDRILTASYFLPVSLPTPARPGSVAQVVEWFRLSVVFDCESARESIVLVHPDSASRDATSLVPGDQTVVMSLFDRLPTELAQGRAALVRSLVAIRMRGRGSVAVAFDDRDRVEH